MLNPSEKGFTLLEATVALLVLVVCTSILVPIHMKVAEERLAVVQSHEALSLLNNQLNRWAVDVPTRPSTITRSGVVYHLNWTKESNHTIQLCVSWTNAAGQDKVMCNEAKR